MGDMTKSTTSSMKSMTSSSKDSASECTKGAPSEGKFNGIFKPSKTANSHGPERIIYSNIICYLPIYFDIKIWK